MSKRYKLLVLQGGGYYGLIDITFLSYLGKDYDVIKHIDSISGCSIGGVLACALMCGADPSTIQQLFLSKGEEIFKKRSWNILNIPWYSDKGLKKVIDEVIGGKTIKDINQLYPNKSMFVPVLNLTKNKLKVYDNLNDFDLDKNVTEICLETSAAMFYFPVRNDNGDAIVDGGVREVCPIMTHAIGLKNKLGIPFEDMDVFVICAGDSINKKIGDFKTVNKWGVWSWLTKYVVNDITASNECTSKFWGENIGFNSFTWWNPIQIFGSMDDPKEAKYILSECEMYKQKFLDKWNQFIKPKF